MVSSLLVSLGHGWSLISFPFLWRSLQRIRKMKLIRIKPLNIFGISLEEILIKKEMNVKITTKNWTRIWKRDILIGERLKK